MKVYIEAYGCTMNRGEADAVGRLLENAGNVLVDEPKSSNAILLFTCTVIEPTERRMLRRIDKLNQLQKPLIVGGCMASIQEKKILDVAPEARILTFDHLDEVARILTEFPSTTEEMKIGRRARSKERADAIVPISQGCLGECTYCITRLARGHLKSYDESEILNQVREHVRSGAKEIRLTAQDTAAYGRDTNASLPELLQEVSRIEGGFRVRVGMMNPATTLPILDPLIEAYRDRKIFKFLHLPVQAGSDKVLIMMRRGYTVDDFIKIVKEFRDRLGDVFVSTDIIVGFPGETEEDFKLSVDLLNRIKPEMINITRFSLREGTPAEMMKDNVPGVKKKERSRLLTSLRSQISREINRTFLGKYVEAITTERGRKDTTMARTSAYRLIVLKEKIPLGKELRVKIVDYRDAYLIGSSIRNKSQESYGFVR